MAVHRKEGSGFPLLNLKKLQSNISDESSAVLLHRTSTENVRWLIHLNKSTDFLLSVINIEKSEKMF